MENHYNKMVYDATAEAGHFDPDDLLAVGTNYFSCGWGKEQYYNHSFSISMALIGSLYGDKKTGRSNYHNGIAFVSNELGITKRQVKVLRKKMKHMGGYSFKTPYGISVTIKRIIGFLKEQEKDPDVNAFLTQQVSDMYREILIAKQFESIKEAARKGNREEVKRVADELRDITTRVGE